MRFVPDSLTRTFGRQILLTQKHSPTILFGVGIVGVIATAVLASKATMRLEDELNDIESDKEKARVRFEESVSSNVTPSDKIVNDYRKSLVVIQTRGVGHIVKLYAPAISVGVISIGCLTGSHYILTQRNVALTAAYAALEQAYEQYRKRVISEVGEDRERELRYSSESKEISVDGKNVVVQVPSKDGPSVYARFFDECSKNWSKTPEYNLLFIRCQQNYANDLLKSRGHVFLNEIYDMLGIDRSKAGAVVGWVLGNEGDNVIDFGVYDSNNERARDFVNGREGSILLDFNVDGVIFDKI